MAGMTHGARTEPRDTIVFAIILIAVGIGALALQVFPDSGGIVVLVIGLALLALFGFTRGYGALVPGGIMTGLGVGIMAQGNLALTDEASGGVVVLGLGLGFVSIWVLSAIARLREHHPWPLIPGLILSTVGAALMIGGAAEELLRFWPVALIALGAVVLWRAWTEMRQR